MAYIVNETLTDTAIALSYRVALGAHIADDLLLLFLAQDGGATTISLGNDTATLTAATDLVTYATGAADIWGDGDQIEITTSGNLTGTGLTVSTRYWVRDTDTTADTFKLAASAGGAAIDITGAGTGTHTIHLVSDASTGWAMLVQERVSNLVRHAVAFCVASSGATAAPTFYGTNDDWLGTCVVVRDAHASPFGSLVDGTDYNSTTYGAVNTNSGGALTTVADGCLILHSYAADGSGNLILYGQYDINDVRGLVSQRALNLNQYIGFLQQEAAGAIATPTFYKSATPSSVGIVCAVRNKASGSLQPDVRPSIAQVRRYGNLGVHDATTTWVDPLADGGNPFGTAINGINLSSVDPSVGTTTVPGTNDSAKGGTFTSLAGTTAGGAGLWVGGSHEIASTDMSGLLFAITIGSTIPSTSGMHGAEGHLVLFSDGTNWVAYQVSKKANGWAASLPFTSFIALGQATTYASSGAINWGAVTRIGYLWHRVTSETSNAAAIVRDAVLFDACALTGGGASRPATFADYQKALSGWGGFQWAQKQGAAQVLAKADLQIGDGTNTTYFDAAASSFEYPLPFATTSVDEIAWNVAANQIALSVYAKASDTINLSAGVVATSTQQALTVHASSSTSAAYSFAGASFVGWLPTFKTGITVNDATFKECGEIAFKGANVTGCSISATTSTDAACSFDANGATVSDTTIDVTGTSAAYHMELGASVTGITLADVTFTGTPGTDKVHVLAASGTVTITISGSTTLVAGDITSAGATVVIAAPQLTLTIAGSVSLAGAEIAVYDLDGTGGSLGTELDHVESNVGATRNVVLAENNLVWVQIMLAGYEEFGQQYTMPGVNSTLTAVLRPDSNA